MHSQNLNRARPAHIPPGMHLQIPLDIPDYRRRPKGKSRPFRATIYFDRESAAPATTRRLKQD